MDVPRGMVILRNPNSSDGNLRDFTFDAVYDWKSVKLLLNYVNFILFIIQSSQQRDLYDETFKPIVDSVLEGYNGINLSI